MTPLTSGMSAGTAKTPQAVEGEARQPGPEGETHKPLFSKDSPMTEQRAREAFELWFFRDLVDHQRISLIRLVLGSGCASEATDHGAQRHCLRGITTALAESAKSPSDSVREALAIEQVAQFLHDEGGFDEASSSHTWPEHAADTGQRDGGFVKIVPSDVQAKFRDVAKRLLTMPLARAALQSSEADNG